MYWTTFDDAQAKTKGSCPIHENEYTHPKKCSTPAPGAPMGRSSPNYLVPVPDVCSTLSQNFTPIAPSCVEISSTVQTNKNKKSKLNITPNSTLYGEIKNYDDMLSRFHLVPERNGRTDGRTDRQTNLLYQYSASVC